MTHRPDWSSISIPDLTSPRESTTVKDMTTQTVLPTLLSNYPLPEIYTAIDEAINGKSAVARSAALADIIEAYLAVTLDETEANDPDTIVSCAALVSHELLVGGWTSPQDESDLPPEGSLLIGVSVGATTQRTFNSTELRGWFNAGHKVYWRPWIGDPVSY